MTLLLRCPSSFCVDNDDDYITISSQCLQQQNTWATYGMQAEGVAGLGVRIPSCPTNGNVYLIVRCCTQDAGW